MPEKLSQKRTKKKEDNLKKVRLFRDIYYMMRKGYFEGRDIDNMINELLEMVRK